MITVIKQGNAYNRRVISLEGLSTDTKPVEYFIETDSNGVEVAKVYIENGSTFTEIDTGKLFMYDAENTVWYEIETSGGGGGGGGGTGTDNYNLLNNKPKVNHVELTGDKSLVDLGILFATSLIAEIDSNTYVVTLTLKDQEGNILGETQSLDLPLESVVVGGRYDNTTKKVILTLQNGNTVEFSVADLVAGLQSELSATNKLNPEFINYNSTHRAVSDTEKSTWNGKQDALTFDNTPTNGSSNPVKSGGVYTALANKVDKVAGKDLSTNDFTNQDKEQITTNKNNISKDEAALVELVDGGAKNLFYMTATSGGTNVIRTVSNGTILLNGTATSTPTTILLGNIFLEANRKYIITGCPQGGADSSYRVDIRDATGEITYVTDYGEGAEFTLNTSGTYQMLIRLVARYQLNNAMFKPMICTPDNYAISTEFVPYRPSYQELYEMVKALQSGS